KTCPEPAKPLALPANDRVGLDVHQGRAPALPQQRESDPEQPVEGSQNGSSPFSLKGRELKAESRVLHRDGRMTAEEESRETKQEQDEGWHEPRFLDSIVMKVKPLPANRTRSPCFIVNPGALPKMYPLIVSRRFDPAKLMLTRSPSISRKANWVFFSRLFGSLMYFEIFYFKYQLWFSSEV